MPEPLSRLFAYPVFPQQPPEGGAVTITADVEGALDEAYRRAEATRGRTVSLILDEDTGTSEVRDALMAVAFGEETSARSAADLLAHRLAGSMDRRSTDGLLVISVHGVGATGEVELWIFPRYAAFRLSGRADAEGIELLDDISWRERQRMRHKRLGARQGLPRETGKSTRTPMRREVSYL